MKSLIIVVCRGNIGRSPFAEAVINQELRRRDIKNVQVTSRGVQGTAADPQPVQYPNITYYKELYEDSKPVLDHFNVDLSAHISRPITHEDAQKADVLLAMDNKTKASLGTLFPGETRKIHLVSELVGSTHDIQDPEVVSGPAKQEQIFIDLYGVITNGFPKLLQLIDQSK